MRSSRVSRGARQRTARSLRRLSWPNDGGPVRKRRLRVRSRRVCRRRPVPSSLTTRMRAGRFSLPVCDATRSFCGCIADGFCTFRVRCGLTRLRRLRCLFALRRLRRLRGRYCPDHFPGLHLFPGNLFRCSRLRRSVDIFRLHLLPPARRRLRPGRVAALVERDHRRQHRFKRPQPGRELAFFAGASRFTQYSARDALDRSGSANAASTARGLRERV